jgi:type I restriction enzyme S subunit
MLYVDEKLSSDDAIGIGRKGTIDKPQLLRAPFWTVDTLFFMVPKNSSCLLFFYALSTKINWKRFDESTGVPSLSKINIQKINLPTPRSREEQIQIGLFNDKIDNLITLHHRKYNVAKKRKC